MKSPLEIGYPHARRILNEALITSPDRLTGQDQYLSPTMIGEYLIDDHDADEEDAFEWAIMWMDEPSQKKLVDPIML